MLQHRPLSVAGMESDDFVIFVHQPEIKVVVLASPALKEVRETVYVHESFGRDGNGTAEESIVRQSEAEHVDAGAHMAWTFCAGVNVSQIHGHQVDVLHHQARKIFLQRILKI